MLRFRPLILLLLLVTLAPVSRAALPLAINGELLPSLAPMLEKIQPAVVNISTTTRIQARENPLLQDPFFRRYFNFPEQQSRHSSSLGSGVIVDAEKGYVITNHHVIDKADEITVTTWDGRSMQAELVGSDAETDVAVIRVSNDQLSEIDLGNSAELRVGDFVVAIGNPFGLSQTVTSGIVSALGRSGLGIEGYEDFIQTDASINPGNSGGALVNLRGELVGINTAIFSRGGGSVGIGFAIPVDMVRALMNQLVEYGDIQRGLLGVAMQDLTPALADSFGISGKKGAIVSQVIADSAAEESGILQGDVIVKFNDTTIDDGSDLRNAVGLLRAGDKARVELYRDGRLKTIKTRIRESMVLASRDESMISRLAGARFRVVEPAVDHNGGIEVVELDSGSPADRSGLAKKDVILSINRQRVKNLEEMEEIVRLAEQVLLVKLLRNDRMLFLVIQ